MFTSSRSHASSSVSRPAAAADLPSQGDMEEEQCPVCWGLLCEPVAWPGCSHHFCLLCTVKTRRRPHPTCPLCRSPAPRVSKASSHCRCRLCCTSASVSWLFSLHFTKENALGS